MPQNFHNSKVFQIFNEYQIFLPLEALATGKGPNMHPLMVLENGGTAELLRTFLTVEGRFSRVNAHVDLVRRATAEAGVTRVAVEGFFTCVLHDVAPQLALGGKLFCAVVTRVHKQLLVQVQVRLFYVTAHRPGGGQVSSAQSAFEEAIDSNRFDVQVLWAVDHVLLKVMRQCVNIFKQLVAYFAPRGKINLISILQQD